KAPPRVFHAVTHRSGSVGFAVHAVHRLKPEVAKTEFSHCGRVDAVLWKNKLDLVALAHVEWRACFRTDANPVQPRWKTFSAVGFDCAFKPSCAHRLEQLSIELEQRFAASEDDEPALLFCAPGGFDRTGEVSGGRKDTSARSIGSYEVCVTEST